MLKSERKTEIGKIAVFNRKSCHKMPECLKSKYSNKTKFVEPFILIDAQLRISCIFTS